MGLQEKPVGSGTSTMGFRSSPMGLVSSLTGFESPTMGFVSAPMGIGSLQMNIASVQMGLGLRVLCAIHPPDAIQKILTCLGLPSRAPPITPARPDDEWTLFGEIGS
jgi:hypothetical protein